MAKALFAHKPSGGTEFTDAFRQTIDQARGAMRPVIVIITDGQISPFTLVTGSAPCSPAPPDLQQAAEIANRGLLASKPVNAQTQRVIAPEPDILAHLCYKMT